MLRHTKPLLLHFVLQELDSSVVAGAVADVTTLCAVLQDQELDPNAVAGAQVAVMLWPRLAQRRRTGTSSLPSLVSPV